MAEQKTVRGRGRPARPFTRAETVRVAQLYYEDDLKQQNIADDPTLKQKLSARDVSRLVREAKELGIVRFFVDPAIEIEQADLIKAKYRHLKEVFIVDGPDRDRHWGTKAANYFLQLWKEHEQHSPGKPLRLALTGGMTFLHMVNAVPPAKREDLHVYVPTLVGHGPIEAAHIDAISIASMLWSRSGQYKDHLHYVTVPPHPTTEADCGRNARRIVKGELERLADNPVIQEALKPLQGIDVLFSRINQINPSGTPDERSRRSMENYLRTIETAEKLRAEGAVGAYAYSLFDSNGKQDDKWQFFLTAGHGTANWGVEFHKHMVRTGRTVVAAGDYEPAVTAALKGEIFNVLITNYTTASAILKMRVDSQKPRRSLQIVRPSRSIAVTTVPSADDNSTGA